MISKVLNIISQTALGTLAAVGGGLRAIKRHPQVLLYPYVAALFILVTFPIVNTIAVQVWGSFSDEGIFTSTGEGPPFLRVLLGLVAFSAFYTIFITAYFTTAMAAGVHAGLDNKKVSWFYGLGQVFKHFPKVTKFALLAIFFFPLSIVAQRHKLPRGLPGVIGSSLSLSMAQLAPVVLTENKGVMDSIRQSVNTLGRAWKENVVIKVLMWLVIFGLLSIGFLPQFVQDHWVDADTAQLIGALTAILLSFTAYVVTRVISSVFTAVLYHHAHTKTVSKK